MSVIEQERTVEAPLTVEQEQVKAGAAWLDENIPGWDERIDLTKLRLQGCFNCILGQLSGDDPLDGGWKQDKGYFRLQDLYGLSADRVRLGFWRDQCFSLDPEGWARLTEAWRDEITSRRC